MADDKGKGPIIIKRKKGGGHGGHHGGAWKLAYADFVTAMMTFFLVMWIVGMDVKTRAGIAEYFANPGAFKITFQSSPWMMNLNGKPPQEQDLVRPAARNSYNIDVDAAEVFANGLRAAVQQHPQASKLAGNLDTTITDQGLRIEFLEGAGGGFFAPGSTELTAEGKAVVNLLGERLQRNRKRVIIEGHTDGGPTPRAQRWELSGLRANEVRLGLEVFGLPPGQITSVSAKADTLLRRPDDRAAPENNRISIYVPFEAQER